MASIDNVLDNTPRVQYTAIAAQVAFAYPFAIFADGDLVVDVDGVTKTLTTDYTVSGAGADNGGTVTFGTAPGAGAIITIWRDVSIARSTDFAQNGPWSSSSLNDELDRLTVVQQDLENKIGRAIRFPQNSLSTNAQAEMSPISTFFGKFLRISSAGILEAAEVTDSVVTLTAEVIGALVYPRSQAEIDASVTPTAYRYAYGHLYRYGTNTTPGTTNMQSALNAAISQAGQTGGSSVFIPAGIHALLTQTTIGYSNVRMYGEGPKSILRMIATAGGSAVHMFSATDKTGLVFEDLRLEGYETNDNIGSICIQAASGCDRIRIRNCEFSGPNGTTGFNIAISIGDAENFDVSNNYLERLIGVSSGNGYGILIHDDCLHGVVRDNQLKMAIGGSASGRHAIYCSSGSRYVSIIGNHIDNCADEAITVYSTNAQNQQYGITIAFNTLTNCLKSGVGITANVTDITVALNQIRAFTGTSRAAIHIEGDATNQPSFIKVLFNDIFDTDYNGIMFQGGSDSIIRGNTIRKWGQAAADTYIGIQDTTAGGAGSERNLIEDNVILQETVNQRCGIKTDAGTTGAIIRSNLVRGTYAVGEIEDDAVDSIFDEQNLGTIVRTAKTGTVTLNADEHVSELDISSAVTATLGSPTLRGRGHIHTIIVTAGSTSSTVSVTNHATSDPEVFTFTAVDDTLVLMWTGTEWVTLASIGPTV